MGSEASAPRDGQIGAAFTVLHLEERWLRGVAVDQVRAWPVSMTIEEDAAVSGSRRRLTGYHHQGRKSGMQSTLYNF
jgi:hypothetical protein